MNSYNGIIYKVTAQGLAWRITIAQKGHINPRAIQTTFLVESATLADFFARNIGWEVSGSIDAHGYMETCNKDW